MFSSGTLTDSGSYNITGATVDSGGAANLTAPVTSLGSTVNVSNGTLNLSGGHDHRWHADRQRPGRRPARTTSPSPALTAWTGGTMSGSGVTNAEGGLAMGGTATNTTYQELLAARTLNNYGTATLATYYASQGLYISSGGTLDNEAGPALPSPPMPTSTPMAGHRPEARSPTRGLRQDRRHRDQRVTSPVAFNQSSTGTLEVQSGTLNLGGGGTIAGSVTVDAGTAWASAGRSRSRPTQGSRAPARSTSPAARSPTPAVQRHRNNRGQRRHSQFHCPGHHLGPTVTMSSGTLNLSGGAPITVGTLAISGGTLTGSDTVTVTGATTWTGGTMSGSGVTNAEGGLTMGGTAANQLPGGPRGPHPEQLRHGHARRHLQQQRAVFTAAARWTTNPAPASTSPTTPRSGPTAAARRAGRSSTRGPSPRPRARHQRMRNGNGGAVVFNQSGAGTPSTSSRAR